MDRRDPGWLEVDRLDEDAAVVALVGEHDMANADRLRSTLAGLAAEGRSVVVDVSRASFVDSAVVNALWGATAAQAEAGGSIVLLVGRTTHVRRVLELGGLTAALPCRDTREDALQVARDLRSERPDR